MRETVPSVLPSIDPGPHHVPAIPLVPLVPLVLAPNPTPTVVVVNVVVVVVVVVNVVVNVVVVVVVVVVVDVLVVLVVAPDRPAIPFVRVRPPELVQPDVNAGPDLEPEHPHDHREDRQRPPGLGAERASGCGAHHDRLDAILADSRTARKTSDRSPRVRDETTHGSARDRARVEADPRHSRPRRVAETAT
jgi:hypothetical protein